MAYAEDIHFTTVRIDNLTATTTTLTTATLTTLIPTAITVTGVGTTASKILDVVNAYTGKIIETGDYASTASNGVTLVAANNRPFTLLFDDAGAALGAADYRASLSRVLVTVDQTNAITLNAVRGHIKALDLVDFSSASSIVASVQGYMELEGTGARTITGRNACLRAALEEGASGTTTVAASSILCGIDITLNSTRTYTETGTFAAMYIGISGGTSNWNNGIFIEAGATDIGIDIGSCTTGINIAGTGAAATSKAITTSGWTVNNANYTDGYGAVECDLTITGTGAGHIAAMSSWLNINTGTHGADGSFLAAQTNGVYEAVAATITGAKVIFGMRAQCICGDTDAAGYFPFSINQSGNTTTALFDAPSPAGDIGLVTDAGSDDGTLVPLYKDSNGNVGYVKVYSLA